MDEPQIAFITATEIFGEKPRHGPAPRAKVERVPTSLSELSIGDYVVHVDHGIGRYMGLKRLKLMGVEADFLEVVYAGADRLYVPVDELVKVQKYIGAEGSGPSLEKLGGVGWERAKARAKKAVPRSRRSSLNSTPHAPSRPALHSAPTTISIARWRRRSSTRRPQTRPHYR